MSGADLTDRERQFLIEHGGLTAADLTPGALAETNAAVGRAIECESPEGRVPCPNVSVSGCDHRRPL